jgi:hypothetical protein
MADTTPEVRLSPDGRDVAIRNVKSIANHPTLDWRCTNNLWLSDDEISDWTPLVDGRQRCHVMPAARTAEEVQADAGAIRFGWGERFAALLEDLLDEDDLMAVLAAWETLLREQIEARAALEAVTSPHGAQS